MPLKHPNKSVWGGCREPGVKISARRPQTPTSEAVAECMTRKDPGDVDVLL